MDTYFILEIGNSASTRFLMKDGEYQSTDDVILVDIIEANSEEEALERLYSKENHKNKEFDNLMIRKVYPQAIQ